jgi:hypothetical protein
VTGQRSRIVAQSPTSPGVGSLEVVNTTVSPRHRSISLLLDSGDTARYALVRRPDGDVHWSLDTFASEHVGGPLQWTGHIGRLTVAQVLNSVPSCRRDVVRWTEEEVEDGVNAISVDIFSGAVRRR